MNGRLCVCCFVLFAVLVPMPCVGAETQTETPPRVLIEWRFDEAGNLRGWVPGGHLADVAVRDGALGGRATDWDPILLGPVFEIPARPTQWIEIRMRASQEGRAELFWTETLAGPFGGFSQEKAESFPVAAGDEFRDYRIAPFWHAVGKVVRLRFDPPSVERFEIASVRILDVPQSASRATSWDFREGKHGWTVWHTGDQPVADAGGLRTKAGGREAWLVSPLLEIPADDVSFLAIRMSADAGNRARVFCVNAGQSGRDTIEFPLRGDGQMHTYHLDMATLARWQDRVVMLGVEPSDEAEAAVCIESIALSAEPTGPPVLQVDFFGSTSGVQRAGRPFEVTALLKNCGGRAADGLNVTLDVPADVEVLDSDSRRIARLTRSIPESVRWQVRSSRTGQVPLKLSVRADGASSGEMRLPIEVTTAVAVTAPPVVAPTDYVPEPRPVRSDIDVGVYYFPGWHSGSRWQPIMDFPGRKPVLGWYDEANPECADWQIKWAVEHGVRFFMVDWYWDRGNRHLEHWLHEAYAKARYRSHLQWAIMWANHNAPGSHSKDDWRRVTQYWIDHYFSMDEYYRIDGRPAVFIWAPANIRNDVGGSESAAELYSLSQQMAREAGYKGIYFVAMSSHESAAQCAQLLREGYEACTSYHGFYLAETRAGGKQFPFSRVVETGPEVWRAADQRAAGLEYFPVVDTGWASEPWHGNQARVIHGRTPELFGQLCRQAAEYARENGKRIVAVGPWNEWGEGSYIEPYAEHGFGDLEQLRRAFCPPGDWPPSLVPADIGRGPYDLPPIPLRTAWQFDTEDDLQGWTPNGALRAEIADGALRAESVGDDPILQGPGVRFEASRYRWLVVRMSSSRDEAAQLFWATTASPVSETNSVRFPVAGAGVVREYRVDLSQSRRWRGVITGLRFDPVARSGVQMVIEAIRLEP
ncbi:MAG: glycoside hydrolase family 99-like domain-containing protein [Pirellulaceae bacterium]|nr:glycoside hydrolase family 99-like domain-containing protein [Pirellulaceae bacterium]